MQYHDDLSITRLKIQFHLSQSTQFYIIRP